MPQVGKIALLPEDIRQELDKKLVANSFSGYRDLSEWLGEKGYDISHACVFRYGVKFKARLEAIKAATEQAKVIAREVGDDEDALGEALSRLAQQKIFQALIDMEDQQNLDLVKLTRAVADLNRSSVTLKKYRNEIKRKAEEAAESVAKTAAANGLSKEAATAIRAQILGITNDTN